MARSKFYSKNFIGHPPVELSEYENPGSYHWMNQALNYECWLKLKMGEEQYYEWAGRLFQEGNEPTWKEISDLYEAKFRVIQGEEREGCTCLPDSVEACPACKADSKRRHGDEIPIGGLK